MATRRMFSKTIISSARFIKMPPSTQMLYFHLGLNADDDGIVEAFPIIRMVGSNEDDLKILTAKNFVIILNEDLVAFITDWNDHNLIRADRKIDSKYKNLLLKILPDIEIKEAKIRADTKKITGRPLSADGQHSIDKDSISQVKLSEVNLINKEDEDLTELLYNLIKQNYSFTKEKTEKQKEGDYEEMNRLHRIDKWTYEQIRYIIEWSQQDDFWKQNIRSVKKLRKQFETLAVRVKGQVEKREVKDYD